jgi:hypothetical protein
MTFWQLHPMRTFFKVSCLCIAVLMVFSISVSAQTLTNADCVKAADSAKEGDTTIDVADIFQPGHFVPVIPKTCAVNENGGANALDFSVIPAVLIRSFGLIASTVFYLAIFMFIFSGVQWIYGGIDGQSSAKALRNIQDSVVAMVLIFAAYVITFTILGILKVDVSTDISTFFT